MHPRAALLRSPSSKEASSMTRRTALLATLAALTLAASLPSAAAASPEKSASPAQLEVTYYYLPT